MFKAKMGINIEYKRGRWLPIFYCFMLAYLRKGSKNPRYDNSNSGMNLTFALSFANCYDYNCRNNLLPTDF